MKSSSRAFDTSANALETIDPRSSRSRSARSPSFSRSAKSAVLRYGLAILTVTIALGLKLAFQHFRAPFPYTTCSMFAVAITVWYAGARAGFFAAALSSVVAWYFVFEPVGSASPTYVVNHAVAVFLIAWICASRRRTERLLIQARGELEAKVAERTAKLSRTNEELQTEIFDRKSAQENLRRSEAFLAEGQRISHTGSWSWNVPTGKVTWSEEHFRIFGFDPETTEPSFQLFLETLHPEDRSFIERSLDEAVREKSGFDIEFRIALGDGSIKHVQGVGRPVAGESGEVDRYVGTTVDITERKRGVALFAGEKRLLEMIATGVPLKEILNVLCLIIEEYRPGTLASVLLLRADGLHLDSAAGPSLPKGWTQQMEKLPIGPCAGSCGTAAYRGSRVIVSDIATDPLWEVPEHRAAALKHGLRASWSNPVLSWKGEVLGTFCMYYRDSRSPTSEDLELIEVATHLVRVAIERDRAEQALRASEQLARSHVDVMMRSLDVLATEAAPEKFIGEMLRTIGQHLRAHRVLLWLRNQRDDSLRLHLIIENDQQVAHDLHHPFVRNPHAWRNSAFIQEMLFTKSPAVCDDIAHDSRLNPEIREYLTRKGAKRFMTVPMFVTGEIRGFIGIQHRQQCAYRA